MTFSILYWSVRWIFENILLYYSSKSVIELVTDDYNIGEFFYGTESSYSRYGSTQIGNLTAPYLCDMTETVTLSDRYRGVTVLSCEIKRSAGVGPQRSATWPAAGRARDPPPADVRPSAATPLL